MRTDYYTQTASEYDRWHVRPGDAHFVALKYLSGLLPTLGAKTVLDVGCGTGRALRHLSRRHPNLEVIGVEPEEALRRIAIEQHHTPEHMVLAGDGRHLPFADRSFDVVCEFGVLHHVATPRDVTAEMLRIARRAVVISDENRFAYGSMPERVLKLILWKLGLFGAFYFLKTRGKGYRYSAEDGIAYSYSVFDALPQLSEWADRVIMIPLDRNATNPTYQARTRSAFQPLFTSFRLLLIAVRDVAFDDDAAFET